MLAVDWRRRVAGMDVDFHVAAKAGSVGDAGR